MVPKHGCNDVDVSLGVLECSPIDLEQPVEAPMVEPDFELVRRRRLVELRLLDKDRSNGWSFTLTLVNEQVPIEVTTMVERSTTGIAVESHD